MSFSGPGLLLLPLTLEFNLPQVPLVTEEQVKRPLRPTANFELSEKLFNFPIFDLYAAQILASHARNIQNEN